MFLRLTHAEAYIDVLRASLTAENIDGIDLSYNSAVLTLCNAIGFIREHIHRRPHQVRAVVLDHTDFSAAQPHTSWPCDADSTPCDCHTWGWERALLALFEACAGGAVETLSMQSCLKIAPTYAVDGAWLCAKIAAMTMPPLRGSLHLTFRNVDSAENANASRWALQRIDCMLKCISDGSVCVAEPEWRRPSPAPPALDPPTITSPAANLAPSPHFPPTKVTCCAPVNLIWASRPKLVLDPPVNSEEDVVPPTRTKKLKKKKRKTPKATDTGDAATSTAGVPLSDKAHDARLPGKAAKLSAAAAAPQGTRSGVASKENVGGPKSKSSTTTYAATPAGLFTSHAALTNQVLNGVKSRPRLVL